MLSKEEKREIFEGVMSQLSTVVEELMAKREKNIKMNIKKLLVVYYLIRIKQNGK